MTAGRTVNSKSSNWCTPPKYVKAVKDVFGGKIGLDPCSNRWSVVNAEASFSLPETDGLAKEWDFRTIFVNPPYGADRVRGTTIKHWLYKCAQAHQKYDAEVLALVPVAANTSHWKQYVWGRALAVCFLYDTRLKFLENGSGEGKGAPMACSMVYWGEDFDRFFDVFIEFGAVVNLDNLTGKEIGDKRRLRQPSLLREEQLTTRSTERSSATRVRVG